MVTVCQSAIAACTQTGKRYISCSAGYYLSGGTCTRCPAIGNTYGTTPPNNTSDITSCCIPGNLMGGEDGIGMFIFSGDCCFSGR